MSLRKMWIAALGAVLVVTPIVAIGAATTSTLLNAGDMLNVTCSGTKLTVTKVSKVDESLACTGATTTTTSPPPPTTTTPPPTTTNPPAASWWVPSTSPTEWQWFLSAPLNTSSAVDMGTGDATYAGAPASNPTVYDIDGIENPASTVSALHELGDHVVCYIEVGTAGNYYTASQEGITTTYYAQLQSSGDLGNKLSGYPEYFVNINSPSTVGIVESMIQQQCAGKGFDAVETDLDETFNGNEGSTGFTITEANEEAYMTTLANYMHSLGLGWFLKDPDDIDNASYANAMYPLADAVLTEQCNQYDTCQYLSAFEGTKAIFDAEYTPTKASSFCPADNSANINGVLFDANLNGQTRTPCR